MNKAKLQWAVRCYDGADQEIITQPFADRFDARTHNNVAEMRRILQIPIHRTCLAWRPIIEWTELA